MSVAQAQPAMIGEPHCTQAYERLRAQALSAPAAGADRRGLAPLERQGVAGWLAATQVAPTPSQADPAPAPAPSRTRQRAAMIGILAAMVDAHLETRKEPSHA